MSTEAHPGGFDVTGLATAEIVNTLTTAFDVSLVMDRIADAARRGYGARSAAVILIDRSSPRQGAIAVAESSVDGVIDDALLYAHGPALTAAADGAVAMIADLESDDGINRWPRYREAARAAGLRSVRAFPIKALTHSVGSVVVHTSEPWGTARPSLFGPVLADLAAIALSSGGATGRRASIDQAVGRVLDDSRQIATAIGIVSELLQTDSAAARVTIGRFARAHNTAFSEHSRAIVAAHNNHRGDPSLGGLLAAPPVQEAPRSFDS